MLVVLSILEIALITLLAAHNNMVRRKEIAKVKTSRVSVATDCSRVLGIVLAIALGLVAFDRRGCVGAFVGSGGVVGGGPKQLNESGGAEERLQTFFLTHP